MRASYEAVNRMLNDPHGPNTKRLLGCLRYTLCYTDIRMVKEAVQRVLSRTATDSLERWDSPYLHLGNAGLNFPRDPQVDPTLPANWNSIYAMGPHNLNHLPLQAPPNPALQDLQSRTTFPIPRQDLTMPLDVVKLAAQEGIWFDCHDVEAYLRSKGLQLNGSSVIAEIEVDVDTGIIGEPINWSSPEVPTLVHSNSEGSPSASEMEELSDTGRLNGGFMTTGGAGVDAQTLGFRNGFFDEMKVPSYPGNNPRRTRKKLILDVDFLVSSKLCGIRWC
jgi:hypothetical protein